MRGLLLLSFLLVGWCLDAVTANAASLYLDPPQSELYRGDSVIVAVRVDVDEASNECVNAADVVISYDPTLIAEDVSLGRSIFPLLVESPVIHKDTHTISFASGIPNGYCGRVAGDPRLTNILAEIVFRAPGLQVGGGTATDTIAIVEFEPETTLYLHDGAGTKATTNVYGAHFILYKTIGREIADPWSSLVGADATAPESFEISLLRGDTEFSSKYYIAFNTTDKQTGISHYEVIEEPPENHSLFSFGAATAPWQEARSPYVLKDQSLRSTVRVKAVDKAGNEYIATIQPQNTSRPIDWISVAAGALLAVFLIAVGIFFYRRRRIVVEDVNESEI